MNRKRKAVEEKDDLMRNTDGKNFNAPAAAEPEKSLVTSEVHLCSENKTVGVINIPVLRDGDSSLGVSNSRVGVNLVESAGGTIIDHTTSSGFMTSRHFNKVCQPSICFHKSTAIGNTSNT